MTITVRRGAIVVAVVATVAVLTACSSSGSGTHHSSAPATNGSSGSTPSSAGLSTQSSAPSKASASPLAAGGDVAVCSLLSAAQASALNHITYGAGTPRPVTKGWDECTYKNNGGQDPVDIQNLKVGVISIAGCFEQLKSALGDSGGTPVSGVGDQAWGYKIGLLVKAGSRCVEVEGLTHAELDGNYAPDVAMAKIVLGKL